MSCIFKYWGGGGGEAGGRWFGGKRCLEELRGNGVDDVRC